MNPSHNTHKPLFMALLLYLAFVIYGSLVPLHFSPRPLAEAIARFSNIPFLQLGIESRADWVANVLLFVPLAFLAAQVSLRTPRPILRIFGYAGIATACAALAVAIEFTQIFFPPRTVSQNDIAAEILGALAGLIAHATIGTRVFRWADKLWQIRTSQGRAEHILQLYLAGLLLFNVLPLDLTLSAAEIYHKWVGHQVQLIPFGGRVLGAETTYELLTDVMVWIPIGILWRLSGHRLAWCIAAGLAFATFIEFLQLFVVSRTTDITDVILAGFGTWLGARVVRDGINHLTWPSERTISLLLAGWIVVVIALFWYPFNFQLNARVHVPHRVLFETYYFTSEYRALNELLRKIATFLPGGLVLAVASRHLSTRVSAMIGTSMFGLVAALIETGQLFLPGKVADVTDWLLETIGGILGLALGRWTLGVIGTTNGAPTTATEVPALESRIRTSGRQAMDHGIDDGHRPAFASVRLELAVVLALAAMIFIGSRLPVMPYNVRELVPAGVVGVVSSVLLALAIHWLFGSHISFISWANQSALRAALLPFWLCAHAMVASTIIMVAAPTESVQDIVGSPVLRWPGDLETFLRLLALDVALALAVIDAAALVFLWLSPRSLSFSIFSVGVTAVAAPMLHWVIVTQAATDNLVELIADNGSLTSTIAIAMTVSTMALSASLICVAAFDRQRRWVAALMAVLIMPAAYYLLQSGLESTIVKYNKVFSAMQFLLSRDRSHYATGTELIVRYAVAYGGLLLVIFAVQFAPWRKAVGRLRPMKHPKRVAPA